MKKTKEQLFFGEGVIKTYTLLVLNLLVNKIVMLQDPKEIFTGSVGHLALFAAMGGCLIRYFEEYRHARKINWSHLALDLICSVFLGHLAFWYCLENTSFTLSQCAIVTCLVGNFGSRVFDIIYYIIFEKLHIPHSLQEASKNDGKRNPQ